MGFDAKTSVEPLDFDFTTLEPCPEVLKKAKGTIPEPDSKTLNKFGQGYYGLLDLYQDLTRTEFEAATRRDESEPEDKAVFEKEDGDEYSGYETLMDARLDKLQDRIARAEGTDESKALEDAVIEWMMIVCRPVITDEQLRALPSRTRNAFMAWLVDELVNPKASLTGLISLQEEIGD